MRLHSVKLQAARTTAKRSGQILDVSLLYLRIQLYMRIPPLLLLRLPVPPQNSLTLDGSSSLAALWRFSSPILNPEWVPRHANPS